LEGTAIAFLEVSSWKFEAPLFIGDTIRVKIRVAEKKPSRSKSDRGIVKLFLEVVNQDGQTAQSGFKTLMIKRAAASLKKI
jgi:acyl dehydratase